MYWIQNKVSIKSKSPFWLYYLVKIRSYLNVEKKHLNNQNQAVHTLNICTYTIVGNGNMLPLTNPFWFKLNSRHSINTAAVFRYKTQPFYASIIGFYISPKTIMNIQDLSIDRYLTIIAFVQSWWIQVRKLKQVAGNRRKNHRRRRRRRWKDIGSVAVYEHVGGLVFTQ